MRVLSWNVFNENPDTDRVDACLDLVEPDITCLQEALPGHLKCLRARYNHCLVGRDYIQRGTPCYLAIASNMPLVSPRLVTHFSGDKPHPSIFSKWAGWVEFLDSLSAYVQLPNGSMLKIINLHTSAATGPSTRIEEIEAAAKAHLDPSGKCLVAGDFNMFSTPALALILALPFGYRLPDLVNFERRTVESWWKDQGFDAVIRGATMPRWKLQLDQVFLRSTNVLTAEIMDEAFGSDHLPINVTLSVAE